ncbi:MAG: methionyl-tRNA formyltransferase [Rhodothermales bacterium]
MRIVFMGTPDFAVPSLERLAESGYTPVAVVTGPDKPRGRGQRITPTPVKKAALRLGVDTILQPESVKEPAFAEEVRALDPDVIVVVAFRILPPDVFTAARKGAFNLHGSLLPKFRGAAPINHAVMNGETETGVTTFFLKEAVDTGHIILQKSMPIGPDETAGDVHDRMMELGAEAVVETVRLIERGAVKTHPQDDAAATPAPKIHREDCRIDWDRPARAVHDQIRGLSPYPGAWTRHGDTLLKVYRSRMPDEGSGPERFDGSPGEVVEAEGRLVVACGTGAVELIELQQAGSRRLSAIDFLNGYSLRVGDRLG